MKEDATFYYIVWVIVLILALIERARKKPFNSIIVSVFFLVAAVIVACRVEVGADWANYKSIFYNGFGESGRDGSTLEPGFMLIRLVFFNLGFTHAVFFLFLSLLSFFAIYKAANLFGIKYFMAVFLVYFSMFFLNYQFNIVRHGIMAAFVWLSFAYYSKGEILAAIVSIIIAISFHFAALFFVPFFFILGRSISKLCVIIIMAFSYLAYFLQLSTRIIAAIPILYDLERTASFVNNEGQFVENYGLTIGSQIEVFLFLYLYFFYKTSYNKNLGFRVLMNSLLFHFMIICVLNSFSAIISRVGNSFFMVMIFLLPSLLEKFGKQKRLIAGVLISFYLFFSSLQKAFVVKEDGYSEMLPYKFELSQLIEKDKK